MYPAIGIGQYLKEADLMFVVEKGRVSEAIVKENGYSCLSFKLSKRRLWTFLGAFFKMFLFFFRHSVKVVLAFGGNATLPVVLAAYLFRIPIILFEQNAVPGRANRVLQYFAKKKCVSFEDTLP